MKKIVLTYGDLNGIGVEILIKALNQLCLPSEKLIIVGSKKVFKFYTEKYNLALNQSYEIVDVELEEKAFSIGEENALSGEHCFFCLKKACELVRKGLGGAIVTAPVSKHVLKMAGHDFSGQTEVLEHFLAQDDEKSEMLFVADNFRILLLTRHLPLKEVSKNLSQDIILEKICRLNEALKNNFGIVEPKIGVLALNPHAGENGILGDEEELIIRPAIKKSFEKGVNVFGPLVSDAEFAKFAKTYYSNEKLTYDCYAAMYHDQGLIPMKLVASEKAVNTTIGLGVIRTSPSHGTAFDIAGKNIANPTSMKEAVNLAVRLCKKD